MSEGNCRVLDKEGHLIAGFLHIEVALRLLRSLDKAAKVVRETDGATLATKVPFDAMALIRYFGHRSAGNADLPRPQFSGAA